MEKWSLRLLKLVKTHGRRTRRCLDILSNVQTAENLQFYFSVFSLVLLSIEKIYRILKTVLDHISKYLEVRQNTALRVVVLVLFSVFGQTRFFLSDILQHKESNGNSYYRG